MAQNWADMPSVRLPSTGRLVMYESPDAALRAAAAVTSDQVQAALQHTDLQPDVYEGGLKLWEGGRDLADFLDASAQQLTLDRRRVLENAETWHSFTRPTLKANEISFEDRTAFSSGDWTQFQSEHKFDLVLSAETVYNVDNYGKLHDALHRCLAEDGIILLAAKTYYFGLSGSLPAWQSFVKERDLFSCDVLWMSDSGVKRCIVQMKRK